MHSASTLLINVLASAALVLGGCGGPALLKVAPPLESSKPLAEGRDERIFASIETVILPNAPGAWARDAEWDEYVIRVRSLSDEPVEIREIAIFDALDHRVEPRSKCFDLTRDTREAKRRYGDSGVKPPVSNGWASAGVVAAGTGLYLAGPGAAASGISGAAAGAAAGAAMIAVLVPVIVGAGVVHLVNLAEVDSEIKRRRTVLPVAVARDSEARVDLFFPVTPRSKRTQIVYADRHGEHRLDIDTKQALVDLVVLSTQDGGRK